MAPTSIENIVSKMRNKSAVTFNELANVCQHYFGAPRISGSHHVYKTPWPFDPRVNIQNDKGKAKAYQIRQVLEAIDKLATRALTKKPEKPEKQ